MYNYDDLKKGEVIYYKSKYRYLATFSFLYGAGSDSERTSVQNGQLLKHESAANGVGEKKFDFLEKYQLAPIDSLNLNNAEDVYSYYFAEQHSIINIPAYSAQGEHFNFVTIYRTTDTIAEDADYSTVENLFLFNKDIPLRKYVLIWRIYDFEGDVKKFTFQDADGIDPLNESDIGSIIYLTGGTQIEFMGRIEGENNFLGRVVLDTGDIEFITAEYMGYIGAKRVFAMDRSELPDGSIYYEIDLKFYRFPRHYFKKEDEGKIITLSNNCVLIIEAVLDEDDSTGNYTRIKVVELGQAPKKIDIFNSGIKKYIGGIGFNGRKYCDAVSDTALKARRDSGASLYFMQTRFHEPLPEEAVGEINSGFLFIGHTEKNEYYYSQMANLFRTGYYHPAYQYNDIFKAALTRIKEYPGKILVIWGENYTYILDLNVTNNAGQAALGEYIPALPDPELITDGIGCPSRGNAVKVADGAEFVFTSEPAIRVFNGKGYTDDLTDKKIHESELEKYNQKVVAHWSKANGLVVRGRR